MSAVPTSGSSAPPATLVRAPTLPYHTGPLADRERVALVLERLGLDGLVVTHPIHVLHYTGYEGPAYPRAISAQSGFHVVVPRDPRLPVGFVIDSFRYYWGYSNVHDDAGVAAYQFTAPPPPGEYDPSNNAAILATARAPLAAGELVVLQDRGQAPLDAMERQRVERTRAAAASHGVAAGAGAALARALGELGLERGVLGTDVAAGTAEHAALAALAPRARFRDAHEALARVRLVKSPAEQVLARHAARNNAEAAYAACRAVRAGASYRDLRATFFAEAARRGSAGVWMLVDRMQVDAYEGRIRDGQAFLIDAVSLFAGYHGDYGRTVFVGEPPAPMRRHVQAIRHAWQHVRERLRPGLRYSEIQALGVAALEQGGYDTAVRITPHSVGLLHTDARGIGDVELEAGMVLSVDFPVLEAGIGGSAHLEDLVLITRDGHELLNSDADPVIQV